ncbi:GNAT family N-acetyltransferase [Dyella sp.]|jgi:predicted GNAT family N-acyltransferase|uniref:GNAT family N-acetyltransferase n=1 Tax=Dyella sp. TaxID=1869338 RepID=UPI002D77EB8B|nr:GNAT family N-acetyltransferase [Dyella sp.]HET6432343.1 GNAT family N-acetyltransferase [Dyella sp.]
MKLENFHIVSAEWSRASDREALLHVRQSVFVEELGVPGLLEADELDHDAFHLIARDDANRVIGTARLTATHQIGRLAVVPAWRRQGVGVALLRQLVDRARALGWPEVRLDAQIDAVDFYRREGFASDGELFEEGGRLHQAMRKPLVAAARPTHAPRDPGALAAHDRASVEEARVALLQDARHVLAIQLPEFDVDTLNSAQELAEIRRIATSGRGARIRILLHDTGAPLRDGHRLVALAQRLSSVIEIRRPVDEIDLANRSACLLNDAGGYLLLPEHDRPQGRAARHDRAGQAPLAQQFDAVWERAERAVELQALHL